MCLFVYDADVSHLKVEEPQPPQNLPEESTPESASSPGLSKNLIHEDDLKAPYAIDSSVCSLTLIRCILFCLYLTIFIATGMNID